MNLDLSDDDRAFRDEVRAFLAANLSAPLRKAGKLATSVFCDPVYSLAWQKILHQKNWVAPSWPTEFGGTGWNEVERYIFESECARANAPLLAPMSINMVGPCIIKFGTEDQKSFFLPRILSGEDYWCQGYSEPEAGSDLASLNMKCVPDGDDYILNGSKIWTTHAQFANRMFCLVRTRTDGKPQTGISFLLLEMDTPGITVEPILSASGEHEVNQVFFENVRVPKSSLLGKENDGWTVAKYLLEFERGSGSSVGLEVKLDYLKQLTGYFSKIDASLKKRIFAAETELEAIKFTELRVLSSLSVGSSPGPAAPLLKIQRTEITQKLDELAMDIAGQLTAPKQSEALSPSWNDTPIGPAEMVVIFPSYLNNRAASIYGGSNEIQRNILAKVVLGL